MSVFDSSHFALLGLPETFAIDAPALESAWRRLQGAVHPDRHVQGSDTDRRLALQRATQVNEAYRVLRDPQRRAAYLCALRGVDLQVESNTTMPPAFLMQQMEWREALEAARAERDERALAGLSRLLCDHRDRLLGEIGAAIDRDGDFAHAADAVRRWMFVDKFGAEVSAAQDGLAA